MSTGFGVQIREGWRNPDLVASLKLLIVTQFFPPDYAPTGQLIEELAHRLSLQGIDVRIFTGQPGYAFQDSTAPPAETIDRVSVRRTRSIYLWSQRIRGKALSGVLFCLRSTLHLLRHAPQTQVLLLTTSPPFLQVLGYGIHRLFGLPYVCLIYDLYPDIISELGVLPEDSPLIQFWHGLNQRIWERAAAIVVLSETMKHRLMSNHPELAPKITVIHNWADPSLIQPIAKQANWFAQTHNLVDPFVVLYSGNTGRCHDLETLLDAAKLLRQEPIRFVFIGGGTQYQACQQQAKDWQLEQVLFLPYQDKAVLPYSLTACDLSIVSIGPRMEGLVAPSKLYSALAAGRPIAAICDSDSYLNALFREANCGQTFRHGDSQGLARFIQQLNHDRALAAELGRSGRQYLETHFSPEHIAQDYYHLLHRVVAKPQLEVANTQSRSEADAPGAIRHERS